MAQLTDDRLAEDFDAHVDDEDDNGADDMTGPEAIEYSDRQYEGA